MEEKPHPRFKRDKNNLIYEANVSLSQALCGTEVNILTLDGRTLNVKIRDIIKPGYFKVGSPSFSFETFIAY